jgi:hypothetical protein
MDQQNGDSRCHSRPFSDGFLAATRSLVAQACELSQKRRFFEHDRQPPAARRIRIDKPNPSKPNPSPICVKNDPFRNRVALCSLAGRRTSLVRRPLAYFCFCLETHLYANLPPDTNGPRLYDLGPRLSVLDWLVTPQGVTEPALFTVLPASYDW